LGADPRCNAYAECGSFLEAQIVRDLDLSIPFGGDIFAESSILVVYLISFGDVGKGKLEVAS
jgi:hypothetical protein